MSVLLSSSVEYDGVVVGYCLPPDTLKNICTQIHVESTLYTLVRGTITKFNGYRKTTKYNVSNFI